MYYPFVSSGPEGKPKLAKEKPERLLSLTTSPPPAVSDSTRLILWISVLVATIIGALFTTVLDNLVKGIRSQRPHNSILLFNECLAEHQSAYVVFFVAMLSGAEFSVPWAKPWLAIALMLSFIFYSVSVAYTAGYDSMLARDHGCGKVPCPQKLALSTVLKMMWVHLLLGAFLFGAAWRFASWTIKPP